MKRPIINDVTLKWKGNANRFFALLFLLATPVIMIIAPIHDYIVGEKVFEGYYFNVKYHIKTMFRYIVGVYK